MKTPVHALAHASSIAGEVLTLPAASARKASGGKARYVNWCVQGYEFVHCNSSQSCGCGLGSWFGHGKHHALAGLAIHSGFRENTKLDGLKVAAALSWPGPIREGKGELIPIIDSNATADQARALLHVMSGEASDPGASFFQVFASAYEKVHTALVADIDLDIDAAGCTLRLRAPARDPAGSGPTDGRPGPQNAIEIGLAHRFDDIFAEIGRGWGQELGTAPLNLVSPILLSGHARKAARLVRSRNGGNAVDGTNLFTLHRTLIG